MTRYVRPARACGWVDNDYPIDAQPMMTGREVDENEPMDTGLLWPDGEPIIRMPLPIGFGRDDEW